MMGKVAMNKSLFENQQMRLQLVANAVQQQFPENFLQITWPLNELTLVCSPVNIKQLLMFLKQDASCLFDQLIDLCGVDHLSQPKRFEVVYHLLSLRNNIRVRLKLPLSLGEPVSSIVDLFPNAGWYERETWDLFGIPFEGNPDMRRLLTDYGFEGHPLRKDFPLTGYVEVRYDEAQKKVVYEPVKLAQEFRRFDFISPWEGMLQLPGDEKAKGSKP